VINVSAAVATPLPAGPAAESCCAPATGFTTGLDAERLAVLGKALSEPIRVRILDALRRHGQPLCQCELTPLFDVSQPTFSHHMAKLREAGLVDVERRHRWAYYSIRPDALKELSAWLT
jgi:ArsR family transcriptional regulator, arsenate/arsenite/antimonite-responsive transcriptional repressor